MDVEPKPRSNPVARRRTSGKRGFHGIATHFATTMLRKPLLRSRAFLSRACRGLLTLALRGLAIAPGSRALRKGRCAPSETSRAQEHEHAHGHGHAPAHAPAPARPRAPPRAPARPRTPPLDRWSRPSHPSRTSPRCCTSRRAAARRRPRTSTTYMILHYSILHYCIHYI